MIKDIINNKDYELFINKEYLQIKNYINIIDINSNKISILLKNKELIINGTSLLITALDSYELLIKGNIKGIEFNDK